MDITMCDGKTCPLKENCFRYIATPDKEYQSYFVDIPYDKKEKDCKYYWGSESNKRKKK